MSLPFYSSDDKRDNRIFVYRINAIKESAVEYIVFDAKYFNIAYDGSSMVMLRGEHSNFCGLCSSISLDSKYPNRFLQKNIIPDASKKCRQRYF